MKAFVTSLDKDKPNQNFSRCGYTTTTFWKQSVEQYGNIQYSSLEDADIVCVFVTFLGNNYILDESLMDKIAKIQKPIVIFDYTEYGVYNGHIRAQEYNLYGYKLEFADLKTNHSNKINEFLMANQNLIRCYFKRELGNTIDLSCVPFKVAPLEFVGDVYNANLSEIDTKDNYYKRLCIYNFIWGFSNYSRPHLHGSLLLNMEKFGCRFALSYKQSTTILQEQKDKFILIANHDWYERVDLNEINRQSMMILDLYGCGHKCFRNVESTKYALSLKQDPSKLKFTYTWENDVNCITLPIHEDFSLDIENSVKIMLDYRHDKHHLLYDIYLKSIETNQLYSPNNYIPNHIIKNIKSTL